MQEFWSGREPRMQARASQYVVRNRRNATAHPVCGERATRERPGLGADQEVEVIVDRLTAGIFLRGRIFGKLQNELVYTSHSQSIDHLLETSVAT